VAYEYRVVPFIAQLKSPMVSSATSQEVASQLQALIARHATDGWEFYRVETVNYVTERLNMARLNFNEVVFRRELKA